MSARLAAVLVSALLLVTGCGGAERPSLQAKTATSSADDQRRADAALLTLADLPPGFTEAPDEEELEEDPLDECVSDQDAGLDEGVTAEAEGTDFEHAEASMFVGSVSVVLADLGLAEDGMEVFASDELRACFDALMAEEVRDQEAEAGQGLEFTTSSEDLAYFEIGDEATAFRMTMGADAAGGRVEFLIDAVFVRKGRTIGMYVFGGLGEGFALEDQVTLINKALARIG